ncbi:ligase [Lactobacillus taiwanensis]|uniref:ATP-dependent DNA ligase n=1 Tax=Lactobacillus taiwanensis TaxID=508451 RepID=UPI00321F8BE5
MSNIFEINDIFKKIKETSSKKAKEEIIRQNSDNELFKSVLSFVYDDFITTGISGKKIKADTSSIMLTLPQASFDLIGLMNYVKEHNTGKLETVKLVQTFIAAFDNKDVQLFLESIFTKNLKVGITAKTINKALGKGFIKEFGCQLAHPYSKYSEKVNGQEIVITQKLDGHRSLCIVDNGKAKFYTRKGLLIDGLDVQEKEVENLVKVGFKESSYVLDGELLLDNVNNLESKDLFRATSKILRSDTADKTGILFNVFDALPLSEFLEGKSTQVFKERKERLGNAYYAIYPCETYAVGNSGSLENHIRYVDNIYEANCEDVTTVLHNLRNEYVKPLGWEGLMINLANGLYVTKRTSDLLKVKDFYEADVVVKDVFEGTGKYAETLGGVVIDYKGHDIRVGSGFSDDERDYYWTNKGEIIGKIIAVQYFEETNNQNDDSISLRFPTFKGVRTDKTVTDVSYEV